MTGTIKCLKCGHVYHCKVEDDYPDSSCMPSGCVVESNCPECDSDDFEVVDVDDSYYDYDDLPYLDEQD